MPNRRTTRIARPGARGRAPSTWARAQSAASVTVAGATKVLLATVTLSNPGISETVRRTRGLVMIESDQDSSAEDQMGSFGMVVVNDLAIAAGAASIPGPVTDANDDGWFVWQPMLAAGLLNGISATSPGSRFQLFEFDSKAMRRVEEGFIVAIMVENASVLNGINVSFAFSMLTSLS